MKQLHLIQLITPLKVSTDYILSCKITAIDLNLQKHHIFKVV